MLFVCFTLGAGMFIDSFIEIRTDFSSISEFFYLNPSLHNDKMS
jgi:hypothetical protein